MNQLKTKGKPTRAFSLIELLVVIAVILLLARIMLPSLDKAKEMALQVQCASNLHQLGVGFLLFNNEYKVMPGAAWPGDQGDSDYVRIVGWPTLSCSPKGTAPNLDSAIGTYANTSNRPCKQTVFHCPADSGTSGIDVSFAMNFQIENVPVSSIKFPTGTYLLMEQTVNGSDMGQCGGGDRTPNPNFHRGGGNVLFVDGHVKWAKGPDGGVTTVFGTQNYDYANQLGCIPSGPEATIPY